MAEFSENFNTEVLKPQLILPVKKEKEDWEDLFDKNQTVNIFSLTVEEHSEAMTVFAEGHVEVHNPANYKGDVHGEAIHIRENNGMLMISVPTNIGAYNLKTYKMMKQEEVFFKGDANHIILFEYPMLLGVNLMPFNFKLKYQFN